METDKTDGKAGDNNETGDKGKISFSAEQQNKIQELIDGTFTKAFGKAKSEYEGALTAKDAEIAKLKEAVEKQSKGGEKDSPNLEMKAALESLKAEREAEKAERKAEKESVLKKVKTAEILKALGKHNIIDPNAVARLVEDDVQIDASEKITVKGQNGAKISVVTGVDMELDEYLTSWLSERQYFVRASGGGAGGHRAEGADGGKTKTINRSEFMRLSPAEQMKFARTEGNSVID